jgi:methionyl-tRNA formyltransferase
MKICLLTSRPSAAIQLVYYAQTRGVRFDDVIIVGDGGDKFFIFKEYAQFNGFGLHFVDDPNGVSCIRLLTEIQPDILKIVLTEIIRKPVLDIPKIGTLNTHAAILPRYRGVDTGYWAVLEGEKVGVVEHFVDEGVDTGDIVCQCELEIRPEDTINDIFYRNHYLNKWQVATKALLMIQNGAMNPMPQKPEDGRHYFAMHSKLKQIIKEPREN